MQLLAFVFPFLLFLSKFERHGGFVGICLGFVFMALMVIVIVGVALLLSRRQKK